MDKAEIERMAYKIVCKYGKKICDDIVDVLKVNNSNMVDRFGLHTLTMAVNIGLSAGLLQFIHKTSTIAHEKISPILVNHLAEYVLKNLEQDTIDFDVTIEKTH